MILHTYNLEVPLVNGSGGAIKQPDEYRDTMIEVSGTFDATISIEGSNDSGNTWTEVLVFIGAAQVVFENYWKQLRVTTSNYVSGTPIVKFNGRKERG